jgi:hypothetical protein
LLGGDWHRLHPSVRARYFGEIAGRQIPLPHWPSPDETHVSHTDPGGGFFRFTISMDHRQLGRTFYQTGTFRQAA